ncbi:VanZ family protein [Streptomyces sp. NPDC048650]|uniref:VanZ family protein n=1 Tax=Streptomyces sp. NPDC048650 TaxID=3365583 RepID=UPI003724BC9E
MIEVSVGALPGLIPAFLVIAVMLGVPSAVVAKGKGKGNSVSLSVLFAVALAGVLTVTLMPGGGGSGRVGICDVGLPARAFLASESARLNVLLFVPVSCLAVLLFRRPISVLAGTLMLTCGVELLQSWTDLGRACSYDDVKANAVGGILGVLVGTTVLWVLKRHSPFARKEAVRGVCAGASGCLILAVAFSLGVSPVNLEAQSQSLRANAGDDRAQDAWLQETVVDLYGRNTRIDQTKSEILKNGHRRLTAETAQGVVVALWPDRKLERLDPPKGPTGTGSLSADRIRAAGDRFARKWFPKETAGSKVTDTAVHGKRGPRMLSYRRYVDGVMMPMRLDLTVSTAGRIVGMTARRTADPKLPTVAMTKAAAKKRAERDAANAVATPVNLLARRVGHAWRPVWAIIIAPRPGRTAESTVFLDAVTGAEVTPEPVEDGGSQSRP